jgi:hypothetical protein
MKGRQLTTNRRLDLELGFEQRRGGQDALANAYERLLPTSSRRLTAIPGTRFSEEAPDAARHEPIAPLVLGRCDPGSPLRPRVHRSPS